MISGRRVKSTIKSRMISLYYFLSYKILFSVEFYLFIFISLYILTQLYNQKLI